MCVVELTVSIEELVLEVVSLELSRIFLTTDISESSESVDMYFGVTIGVQDLKLPQSKKENCKKILQIPAVVLKDGGGAKKRCILGFF